MTLVWWPFCLFLLSMKLWIKSFQTLVKGFLFVHYWEYRSVVKTSLEVEWTIDEKGLRLLNLCHVLGICVEEKLEVDQS